MASAARLERLHALAHVDLDALPDREPEPIVSDSDSSGGVALSHPVGSPRVPPSAAVVAQGPNTVRHCVPLEDAHCLFEPPLITKALPYPLSATHLVRGDLAPAAQHYTPILALSKYPYTWCDKSHSQSIVSAFFDQGKFWAREWHLYYIWDVDKHAKPLVLVQEAQFQGFLDEINAHLGLSLRITDQQRKDALVSRFPGHPRCTPRYLGASRSREDYHSMVDNAPDHDFRAAGEPIPPPLDERTLEAFKQLMEESFEAQRAKNKVAKARKQQERIAKQKTMTDQFKRGQRYLGLRPSLAANAHAQSAALPAIDATQPVPFDFDQSVVFVCVDVESYERAHHKITEVGVATLDTRDLANIPPGHDGENWRRMIHARHFRIKENAHLVNSQFVQGCPENFDFGSSTIVPLAEAPSYVAACFRPPFGAHYTDDAESVRRLMMSVDLNEERNIILLGHDTLGDVRYLQNLGYDPLKIENLLEALDTVAMYRVWRREQNPTSLGKILYDFDIAGYNLHNAGNDAVFTVQAMLAICVREASIRGSPELDDMRKSDKSARLTVALRDAQQKAHDEADGWSDDELNGDGGQPVPISISPPKLAPAHASARASTDSNARGTFRGGSHARGRGRMEILNTLDHSRESRAGYNSRGRGRSDSGQPGALRSSTRGGVTNNERVEPRGRGSGFPRGRGRGRES